MQYKPFQEMNLSRLGLGNMRLPKTPGKGEAIDEASAREIVEYAYEHGVNYFDTAFRYHGGESEPFVGKVLSQYPRESFHLATKMPGHMMEYKDGKFAFTGLLSERPGMSPTEIFERQLENCRVDYFDFYLLHNVCETAYGFYTDEEIGVVEYLMAQKKAGRIRHLGFSAHGRADTIDKFLNEKKGCFEFAQIQLNYLDWTLQDAKGKYDVLTKHGLPVIVMEPVRGGRLADLGSGANALLLAARPEDSIAKWAFRFLQSLPNVQLALSGMSTMEQVKENIETFSKEEPTTAEENALLEKVVEGLINMVPCTGCRYCTEDCPVGLDIPKLINMYNESRFSGASTLNFTLGAMEKEQRPGACIACGACARVCPQSIDIPDVMIRCDEALSKIAGWKK